MIARSMADVSLCSHVQNKHRQKICFTEALPAPVLSVQLSQQNIEHIHADNYSVNIINIYPLVCGQTMATTELSITFVDNNCLQVVNIIVAFPSVL